MGFDYVDLDDDVRGHMLAEFELDASGELYLSKHFSNLGAESYPAHMRTAIQAGNDASLAEALRRQEYFNSHYMRAAPGGGSTRVRVSRNVAETFAQGEFNRFYLRGLCSNVLATSGEEAQIEIYRARASANPRPESQAMVGKLVLAAALLADLRAHKGLDLALGIPAGPNSGLSARRPRIAAPPSE
ncbi:hypothetical protein FA014_03820 [Cellulomonas hominis]|uniref:Uncharacterized protein n=1 Tax=Cellulomonas hominis TaxID=156981 RepID=A0A7Z8K2W5_9CELL|nr:hypothetical protein [Cellulomonas hominis]TKR26783.1 hypothetical protein FA014_03820 [Cellulomonas hominis]